MCDQLILEFENRFKKRPKETVHERIHHCYKFILNKVPIGCLRNLSDMWAPSMSSQTPSSVASATRANYINTISESMTSKHLQKYELLKEDASWNDHPAVFQSMWKEIEMMISLQTI